MYQWLLSLYLKLSFNLFFAASKKAESVSSVEHYACKLIDIR